MNLNDKRVIHTRRAIRQALLDLMKKKAVSQITVKEICDISCINRNTFYAHYGTPVDVLAEIENEYYEKLQATQETALQNGDVTALILGIMNTLLENRDFSIVLYGDNNDIKIKDRNYKDAYSRVMLTWIETGTLTQANHLRWLFTFMSGGIDFMIRTWVQNDMREDPNVIASLAGKMCDASSESIFNLGKQASDL